MEINKKELRKVSRKFRTFGSNVINAHFREQTQALSELIKYIDNTPVLIDYIQSLSYPIDDLESIVEELSGSYSRATINLGDDTEKRVYLLYRVFKHIVAKELDTINFGYPYAGSGKFKDCAKAFGDRLVYPFISGVEMYLQDISTDMGYDDNSMYNISINSSGVQVNIAQNRSFIEAHQINETQAKEVEEKIREVEKLISALEDTSEKESMAEDLEMLKEQLSKTNPEKSLIKYFVESLKKAASAISGAPKLIEGIKSIADFLGL